jgi:hypothetical protein
LELNFDLLFLDLEPMPDATFILSGEQMPEKSGPGQACRDRTVTRDHRRREKQDKRLWHCVRTSECLHKVFSGTGENLRSAVNPEIDVETAACRVPSVPECARLILRTLCKHRVNDGPCAALERRVYVRLEPFLPQSARIANSGSGCSIHSSEGL